MATLDKATGTEKLLDDISQYMRHIQKTLATLSEKNDSAKNRYKIVAEFTEALNLGPCLESGNSMRNTRG